MTRMTRSRVRSEGGQAGAEVIVGGVVLLVAVTLVLTNVWVVLDTKMAASEAARTAAQAYVEENDAGTALAVATATAERQLSSRFGHAWKLEPLGARFARCEPVDVRVEITVGLIAVPFLGSIGGHKTVSSTHRTRIDPYRSGIAGEVACDG